MKSIIDKMSSRTPYSIYENEIFSSNSETVIARYILSDKGKTAIIGLDELVDNASFLYKKETGKIMTSYELVS